jgi:hypothetical protein
MAAATPTAFIVEADGMAATDMAGAEAMEGGVTER